MKTSDDQLIMVIGLPGCGKTNLCRMLCKSENYTMYDDFIDRFVGSNILVELRNGRKICVNDPRLCIKKVFDYYFNIFLNTLDNDHQRIKLMVFDNNPTQCKINIQYRMEPEASELKTFTRVCHSIDHFTIGYVLDNYMKCGVQFEIRQCFNSANN